MQGGFVGMLTWLRTFLQNVLDWFGDTLVGIGAWMRGWMESAWSEISGFLVDLIPEGVQTMFADLGDIWVIPAYEIVAYAFPLQGIFVIATTTIAAVGGVRLLRWGLALIPRPFTGVD